MEIPGDSCPKGLKSSSPGEREGLWKLEVISYLMWKILLEISMQKLKRIGNKYKEH